MDFCDLWTYWYEVQVLLKDKWRTKWFQVYLQFRFSYTIRAKLVFRNQGDPMNRNNCKKWYSINNKGTVQFFRDFT